MQIRLKEPHRQRATLVTLAERRDPLLEQMLLERGVVVIAHVVGLAGLSERAAPLSGELAVVYADDAAEAGASAIVARLSAQAGLSILVIAASDDPEHINALHEAGAHAVLPIGVASDRLSTAIASARAVHEQIDGHRRRAAQAEQALTERKLIERAKGILMETRRISEPEAFRHLQTTSMQKNQSLPEVARTVIAAKELLG